MRRLVNDEEILMIEDDPIVPSHGSFTIDFPVVMNLQPCCVRCREFKRALIREDLPRSKALGPCFTINSGKVLDEKIKNGLIPCRAW